MNSESVVPINNCFCDVNWGTFFEFGRIDFISVFLSVGDCSDFDTVNPISSGGWDGDGEEGGNCPGVSGGWDKELMR